MVDQVSTATADRRRIFWTTQPNTDTQRVCGADCGITGLVLIEQEEDASCLRCQTLGTPSSLPDPETPKNMTIANNAWVLGLLLNILQTKGRVIDTPCGVRPGSAGGHWSESFAGPGAKFGNLLHTIKDGYKMSDLVKLASQYAKMACEKLVRYGVANSVDVETIYMGGGVVSINVTIYGTNGLSENVAISGSIVNNYWVWQS